MSDSSTGYVDGKRKVKSLYAKTRKEAAEKLRVYQQQHDHGITLVPERLTVQQFLKRWLATVVRQRNRATTHEIYGHSVRRIVKHLGHLRLRILTPDQVQTMLQALGDEGYAPATVDRARDVLINALETAVRWRL